MYDTAQIIWALLFGATGLGFFLYGRKQRMIVPLFTGVALMVFPYFISNLYLLVIVGVVLAALPYFYRI